MSAQHDNLSGPEAQASADGPQSKYPEGTVIMLLGQLAFGGGERHMLTLANAMSRQFNVALAYLRPGEGLRDQIQADSLIEARCLNVERRVDTRAVRELASMVEQHSAHTIVCANANALMYAHLARAMSARRLVIVEIFHTTKPRSFKEWLSLLAYRPFFWAAHQLVFVCQAQRRYWTHRALLAKQNHVIYNGVDTSYFEPVAFDEKFGVTRRMLGFDLEDRVVGICAVLRPEKAHTDLLAAVAALRDEGCIWRVLMIGDGPMRTVIEREVARLGLTDSVRITGFQTDVRQLVACCDVMALVSTSETFSIASLEAMAMGKPMIMSDVGGAREQVEHGVNGFLFRAGDVRALAQCLRESSNRSRTRELGKAARQKVSRDFSLQSMLDAYGLLLREVVTRRTPATQKLAERKLPS